MASAFTVSAQSREDSEGESLIIIVLMITAGSLYKEKPK